MSATLLLWYVTKLLFFAFFMNPSSRNVTSIYEYNKTVVRMFPLIVLNYVSHPPRLPSGQQKPAADIPYAIFTQEEAFQPEIRRASIERVCLPILRLASNGTVIEFFMDHIHELVRLLDVKLNTVSLKYRIFIFKMNVNLLQLSINRLHKTSRRIEKYS